MAETKMQLVDWLDDLCVRFIINLPEEELASPERICFQIEEAQWFYEDFIRPLDPTLPSLNLRKFCDLIFQHCPLLSQFSELSAASYQEFLAYKTRVPVRGAIMLNEDMTEVVLVKGWKKGAKWSFPRGKINKDEKDLDCAIREVYEETGYDIKAAGLVPMDEDVKALDQTMREQHMRLFVFRGVPMDTYFEPRTRKEISKIAWYKLADLPTLKKEKHNQQHGIVGEDTLKGSHFYMVAPFIRALKVWIKQQRRLDKMQGKAVPKKHVILEEDEAVDEQTADEAMIETTDVEDSGHMDRLLSSLRNSQKDPSDPANLPEVSDVFNPTIDMSAELKRMLSVGGLAPEVVPQQPEINPLLAILRGSQIPVPQPGFSRPLQTPADQIVSTPPQATTPHHIHPRPPQFSNMGPPPQFPYSPSHGNQGERFHPHGPRPFPNQQPMPNGFFPNGPNHVPQQPGFLPQRQAPQGFPGSVHQGLPPMHQQQVPKPWERTTQFAPQFPQYNSEASIVPPASNLPPPRLSNHALSLLNVFKSPTAPLAQPAPVQKQPQQSIRPAEYGTNLPVPTQVPSVPQIQRQPTQSPALHQPQATKPRTAQQDSLLNLFRAPSTSATAPGLEKVPSNHATLEPVELSAQPSPHVTRQGVQTQKLSMRHLPSLNTAPPPAHSPGGLTSATVSGPLNAPNFESVKRRPQRPAELGNGDQASPKANVVPNQFHPTAILARGQPQQHNSHAVPPRQARSPPAAPLHTGTNRTSIEAPQAFHPTTILRRPNREIADMMESPLQVTALPPQPAQQPAPAFDKRSSAANGQKQTLLNLFGGVSATSTGKMLPPPIPVAPRSTRGNTPLVSALPGTVSGVGSPVSPLPSHVGLAANNGHAGAPKLGRDDSLPISLPSITSNPRSRIGSLVSETGTVVHQHTAQGSFGHAGQAQSRRGSGRIGSGQSTPATPVDKNFLLGFLENVANSAPVGVKKRNI